MELVMNGPLTGGILGIDWYQLAAFWMISVTHKSGTETGALC